MSDWSSDVCSSDLVPKMARRILGGPWDRPATVFGGLTFGGGPIANYMSHAIVSMVETLRREGRYGFLFANGGFATDNHCIVLGKEPIRSEEHTSELQSLMRISYAVFCLKKKKRNNHTPTSKP